MSRDQAGNKSGPLGLFDEFTKECGGRNIALQGADRLLDRGKIAGKNSGAREFVSLAHQLRPQTGQRVEALGDKLVERPVRAI